MTSGTDWKTKIVAGMAFAPVLLTLLMTRDPGHADNSASPPAPPARDQGEVQADLATLTDAPVTFAAEVAPTTAPIAVEARAPKQPVSSSVAAPAPRTVRVDLQGTPAPAAEAKIAPLAEATVDFASVVPAPSAAARPEGAPPTALAAQSPAVIEQIVVPDKAKPVAPVFAVQDVVPAPARVVATAPAAQAAPIPPATDFAPKMTAAPKVALADWHYELPESERAPVSSTALVEGIAARSAAEGQRSMVALAAAVPAQRPVSGMSDQRPATRAGLTQPVRQVGVGRMSRPLNDRYKLTGSAIEVTMPVTLEGQLLGRVSVHVAPNDELSLHLKDLVDLFKDRLDPAKLAAFQASSNIGEFVTFERLRSAGIGVRYDAARDGITIQPE